MDDEEESLKVFKNSIKNLDEYKDKKKNNDKNKNICKLFCIGYIKTFCYNFINFIKNENEKDKIKDPIKIIQEINSSKTVSKIITLYIYKIIYNLNDKDAYLFSIDDFIKKYKLNEYKNYKELIINVDDCELINQFQLYKDYENIYIIIEKYKFEQFKNVKLDEFTSEEVDKSIDKFYFASSNLILSNLIQKGFDKSETYINFYNKICSKLYTSHKILKGIKLFYEPSKYEKIKKEFEINKELLKILLYSYRYCLNELSSSKNNDIYSLFYDKSKIKDINKYYYPGNDIKNIPEVYIKI